MFGELRHQLLVDVQATAGVDDQHVLALGLRAVARPRGDLDRVAVGALLVDVGAGLRADLDQLLDGGRPVDVAGGDGHRGAVLLAQVAGELAGGRRLARALQPGHQRRRSAAAGENDKLARGAAHQLGQLVGDDLHHLLAGVELADHVGAERPLLDRVGEALDDLEVDVGLEQREADLAHRGGDVVLGQRAAPADVGERRLELLGERVEHRCGGLARSSALTQVAACRTALDRSRHRRRGRRTPCRSRRRRP